MNGEHALAWVLVFLSGVVAALAGAVAANVLQRQWESKRLTQDQQFEVYSKLMELQGYFVLVTMGDVKASIRRRIGELTYEIAAGIRRVETIANAAQILHALFSFDYETQLTRYEHLQRLTTALGEKVNPHCVRTMESISQENMRKSTASGTTKPPALF